MSLQLLPTARSHLKSIFPDLSEAELLAAVPLDGDVLAMDTLKARSDLLTQCAMRVLPGLQPRLCFLEPPVPPPT